MKKDTNLFSKFKLGHPPLLIRTVPGRSATPGPTPLPRLGPGQEKKIFHDRQQNRPEKRERVTVKPATGRRTPVTERDTVHFPDVCRDEFPVVLASFGCRVEPQVRQGLRDIEKLVLLRKPDEQVVVHSVVEVLVKYADVREDGAAEGKGRVGEFTA